MFNNECIMIKDIRPGLKNINVVFIVLEVGAVTLTKENREVRTFKVGDPTASINVSIWDEPGKLLQPGDIVRLTKGYASVWRNSLTLYSGKNGEILKIGEFCMVFNEQLNMSEPNQNFTITQTVPAIVNNGAPNNGGPPSISIPGAPINSRAAPPVSPIILGESTGTPPGPITKSHQGRFSGGTTAPSSSTTTDPVPSTPPPVVPTTVTPPTAIIKTQAKAPSARISRTSKQVNSKAEGRR